MATRYKNAASFRPGVLPSAKNKKFGIVVSQWNREITGTLYHGAFHQLLKQGAEKKNIRTIHVPGSFELPSGAQCLAESLKCDAIICIGCIIRGETQHYEFIANAVAKGIMDVSLCYRTPVIFCVLTTDTLKQAKDRAGGKYGNKGIEAATAAIEMTVKPEWRNW